MTGVSTDGLPPTGRSRSGTGCAADITAFKADPQAPTGSDLHATEAMAAGLRIRRLILARLLSSIKPATLMIETDGYLRNLGAKNVEMPGKSESRFSRLRRSIHEIGPLYTAQNAVKSAFPERVLRANTLFIVEIDVRNWPKDPAPDPGMRWAVESDAKNFRESGMPEAEFLDCLGRGAQIPVYEPDGVFVGYFIFDTGDIAYYPWLRFRLTSDVIWTSMTWVSPQFRGSGIHARIRHFAYSAFSRQGTVRMLASVDALNIPSLRASMKKCTIAGVVSFVRTGTLTAVWVNGRPKLGRWHEGTPLALHCDLFHSIPNQPYGPVDAERFERLIGNRP